MNKIKERAKVAAWQIFEEIGLSQHSVDRVSEIIAEKILEQKAIDDANLQERFQKVINGQKWHLIDKACYTFCHTGCPHKTDSYNCFKDKCDTWKIFRKAMEE